MQKSMSIVFSLSPDNNIHYLSSLVLGLMRIGGRQVRFQLPVKESTLLLRAAGVKIAFDLHDSAVQIDEAAFEWCDVYLKRSLTEKSLWNPKLLPAGLNYTCRSLRLFALTGCFAMARFKRSLQSPPASAYEWSPERPVEHAVFFQTRIWATDELASPDEEESVNEARIAIVRHLRARLGPRFRGGIVPTDLARKRCPDALSTEPYRMRQHIANQRRFLIAIYTEGLHGSVAFKMAEYLASSKCIVSPDLNARLPAPLLPGVHYVRFRTLEECSAACEQLLSDIDFANRMRMSNWLYYRREVEPVARVISGLERAITAAQALGLSTRN